MSINSKLANNAKRKRPGSRAKIRWPFGGQNHDTLPTDETRRDETRRDGSASDTDEAPPLVKGANFCSAPLSLTLTL